MSSQDSPEMTTGIDAQGERGDLKQGALIEKKERLAPDLWWGIAGLCAITASIMIMEVTLTKFVSFKVHHHYVYAIISTVVLSLGASGTCLFLSRHHRQYQYQCGRQEAVIWAVSYAVSLILAVLLFCWIPIDPYNTKLPEIVQLGSLPFFFLLFGVPFFLAGLCVSHILSIKNLPIASFYFFDLLSAAAGALATPWLLETCGGYGTVFVASLLGIAAGIFLNRFRPAGSLDDNASRTNEPIGSEDGKEHADVTRSAAAPGILSRFEPPLRPGEFGRGTNSAGVPEAVELGSRDPSTVSSSNLGQGKPSIGLPEATVAFDRRLGILGLGYVVASCLLLWYPDWSCTQYGFDIRTSKDASFKTSLIDDFGSVKATYWNAVARVDVSMTGSSSDQYLVYGLANKDTGKLWSGRLALVDGGAVTRQLQVTGPISEYAALKDALWASPYIVHQTPQTALVIGGGGGIDVLIAKSFRTSNVDVVELNPAIYKHLLCGENDPEHLYYQDKLESDSRTRVKMHNCEGRHFAVTSLPASYDIIQASGVDTLTAITSGALGLADNYLYTIDAVHAYARSLKPDGVLSLTHWRLNPPSMALRMFLTYIEYLESMGVSDPSRHILVVANSFPGTTWGWTDTMLKPKPFTEDEVQRIRFWAERNGYAVLFDPISRHGSSNVYDWERIYQQLGSAGRAERKAILRTYPLNVSPVSDDKPYFYNVEKHEDFFHTDVLASAPGVLLSVVFLICLLMVLVPYFILNLRGSGGSALAAVSFASSSFAFFVFEVALISLFSVPVGGVVAALTVVLVPVLVGYALGSLLVFHLKWRAENASPRLFLNLGAFLFLMCALLSQCCHNIVAVCLTQKRWPSMIACALVSCLCSIVCALPGVVAMEIVKRRSGAEVAWMWGITAAFNGLGAMSFAVITQSIGLAASLMIVGCLYLTANVGFSLFARQEEPAHSQTSA